VTKADLVGVLARASGGSKSSAEQAMDAFLEAIRRSLRRGDRVTLSGFGTFVVSQRAARAGRDPRTGAEIRIPAARVPRFRPSRSLRAALK
jgi:DNA-binding protein HU-beta